MLQPGQLLGQRYRVERLLGEGGMARVFAVTAPNGERLAVKILLPEYATKSDIVTRFLREARTASTVRNPHVARIHDVAVTDTGAPYLVMEHLEGLDLAHVLESRGQIPYAQAVDWVLEAAEGIAEAHAQKIIHRDIKPSNLFLTQTPAGEVVKVLDFGIAKSLDDGASLSITKTSALLGSPLYMSPEQLRGSRDLDVRGDIWALGIVLHELIAGTPPFNAATLPELSFTVLSAKSAPPLPNVPSGLAQVVATCLAQDREQRFKSLTEFAEHAAVHGSERARASAERIAARIGVPSVRTPLAPHAPRPEDLTTTQAAVDGPMLLSNPSLPSVDATAARAPAKTGRIAMIALVGIAAAGLLGTVATRSRAPRAVTATTSAPSSTSPPAEPRAVEPPPIASAEPVATVTASASAPTAKSVLPKAPPKKPPTQAPSKNLFDGEN